MDCIYGISISWDGHPSIHDEGVVYPLYPTMFGFQMNPVFRPNQCRFSTPASQGPDRPEGWFHVFIIGAWPYSFCGLLLSGHVHSIYRTEVCFSHLPGEGL